MTSSQNGYFVQETETFFSNHFWVKNTKIKSCVGKHWVGWVKGLYHINNTVIQVIMIPVVLCKKDEAFSVTIVG